MHFSISTWSAAARCIRLALEKRLLDLLSQVLVRMADHPAFNHLGICIDPGHANSYCRDRAVVIKFVSKNDDEAGLENERRPCPDGLAEHTALGADRAGSFYFD